MAELTFFCPYTNKPIDSGVEIDSREISKMGKYPVHLRCPHCNSIHHGVVADGRITPDPPSKTGNPKKH